MAQIDLKLLTKGEVFMLSGAPRGVAARELFKLDQLEQTDEAISICAPEDLDTVTPSFVQGFLAKSVVNLGAERFKSRFDLSGLPEYLAKDFLVGIERLLMRDSNHHPNVLTQ